MATFYELFRTDRARATPTPSSTCASTSPCRIQGRPHASPNSRAGGAHVHESPCLGQCERAPGDVRPGLRQRRPTSRATPPSRSAPPGRRPAPAPAASGRRRSTRRRSTAYRAHGGYEALARAIEIGSRRGARRCRRRRPVGPGRRRLPHRGRSGGRSRPRPATASTSSPTATSPSRAPSRTAR